MFNKLRNKLRSPAYQIVVDSAKRNWSLLTINLLTNLLSAGLEGSTLGVIYIAISLFSDGASMKIPGILSNLFESFAIREDYIFIILLLFASCLQLFLALSKYINRLSAAYFSAKLQPQVTNRVFDQIMSFSFACASNYKVGDLTKYASEASSTVDNQISIFNDLVINISFIIVYSFILVKLSVFLAIAAVLLAVTIITIQRILLPRIRKVAFALNDVQVNLSKQITENIQALRLIHTFGKQEHTKKQVANTLSAVEVNLRKKARLILLSEPILETLPILSFAVLSVIAYLFSPSYQTFLPRLLTFLLALQRLSARLRGASGCFTRLADSSAKVERLTLILSRSDKEFILTGGEKFEALNSDIFFQNVSLSYIQDEEYALKDLNFTIAKNQVTALVGQSGAGKSSIVDLLIGLYQPTSGAILVNNQNLIHYSPDSWREHLGVVSQDTFIFNTSIFENLRYGYDQATDEDVIQAAQAAQAHNFIVDLPQGYDTIVGERGYRLSGGQRQRLALARAILKQPDLLILDEATSALDSHSELLIQEALAQFQKNRTVVVVAHRLSTIVNADQILVLHKGRLLEQGTHNELIKQSGNYANYWNLQTSGRLKKWKISRED